MQLIQPGIGIFILGLEMLKKTYIKQMCALCKAWLNPFLSFLTQQLVQGVNF